MNFILTSHFKKAYKSLPQEVKNRVKETLRTFSTNPRYPSLHTKKIKSTKNIWEMRVSSDYRITFQMVKDYLILRNVGHHEPTLKNP